jgi:hypothetical protein
MRVFLGKGEVERSIRFSSTIEKSLLFQTSKKIENFFASSLENRGGAPI